MGMVGKDPFDRKGLALELCEQAVGDGSLHPVAVHYGTLFESLDLHQSVLGRTDQTVFRREERAIKATDGIIARGQQLEIIEVTFEVLDTPFGRTQTLSGARAEL